MELPGRCGDWLDTATVTVQGSRSGSTRRARGGDFYLATSGDLQMATCGDFLMATDKNPSTHTQLPAPRTSEHQGHPFQVPSRTSCEDSSPHMTIGQAEP